MAVAIGLAVGVGFIASIILIVSASPSFIVLKSKDDYLKHASTLNEVKVFQAKYPNAIGSLITPPNDYTGTQVIRYAIPNEYHTILDFRMDSHGRVPFMELSCSSNEGYNRVTAPPQIDVSMFLESKYCP